MKHINWLAALKFDQPLLRDVFDNYYTEMQHCMQRLADLDRQVEQLAQSEDYREMVGLLRCFRGIDTLTAISIITEIFDFGRFPSAREFMSYLGLTPSERSSGDKERKGSITRAGNRRVRRLLTESSWHCRHGYNVSKRQSCRNEKTLMEINIGRRRHEGQICVETIPIGREFGLTHN